MEAIEQAAVALQRDGVPFLRDEPLAAHTTFKIGGPAALFCTPGSAGQLALALAAARRAGLPHMLLGKGSNVLFCDNGYPGLVICPAYGGITVEGGKITADAGVPLGDVCLAARDNALAGLEFAWGIPGGVGGAVYMNAGAFDGEMRGVLESVSFLDEAGAERSLPVEGLELGYRTSVFQRQPWCILRAVFALKPGRKAEIAARMEEHLDHRRARQPLDLPSAGSAFKRPAGAFAGALIDQCGLRGHRVGGAAIDQKHCGFIVNLGGATCADVLALADEVAAKVREQTGYVLEKEIRVVKA